MSNSGDLYIVVTKDNVKKVAKVLMKQVLSGTFCLSTKFDPADLDHGVVEFTPSEHHDVIRDWKNTLGPDANFDQVFRSDLYKKVYRYPQFEFVEDDDQGEASEMMIKASSSVVASVIINDTQSFTDLHSGPPCSRRILTGSIQLCHHCLALSKTSMARCFR